MVSLNSILTLGALGGAALLYFKYGGLGGIGQALGGAVSGFGSGITQGLNRFGNLVTTPESNALNTTARVIEQEQLGEYITEAPTEDTGDTGLTPSQKSGLTYAGFVQAHNLGGTINLRTNELKNQYGIQPLDFTFDGSGGINTGREGLADSTLESQRQLSQKYGIPTFDVLGNLSTFGGLTTSNPYGNYANPDYPVTS